MCKKSARKPVRDFESEGPSYPTYDGGVGDVGDVGADDDVDSKRLNCSSSIGRQERPGLP
jgi:hypothetical protein